MTDPTRWTTLRLTHLDTDNQPTGYAVVVGGWFQLSTDDTDTLTARLEAAIAPDGPQLIATREPVMLELWARFPGVTADLADRWDHLTIHALGHFLPVADGSSPDGTVAFTGPVLTDNGDITTRRLTSELPERTP